VIQKLTVRLIVASVILLTLAGCLGTSVSIEPNDKPLFCDVEEPRRFTQQEVDWRVANAPSNFRLDIKTNETWDRECKPEPE